MHFEKTKYNMANSSLQDFQIAAFNNLYWGNNDPEKK